MWAACCQPLTQTARSGSPPSIPRWAASWLRRTCPADTACTLCPPPLPCCTDLGHTPSALRLWTLPGTKTPPRTALCSWRWSGGQTRQTCPRGTECSSQHQPASTGHENIRWWWGPRSQRGKSTLQGTRLGKWEKSSQGSARTCETHGDPMASACAWYHTHMQQHATLLCAVLNTNTRARDMHTPTHGTH